MQTPKTASRQATVPVHLPSLLAFSLVARHMNFARAADDFGVSPTAMSKTIKSLEEQLETRLFNRTTRSVSLTETGAELLKALQPALEQIRASVDQVVEKAGKVHGELRINSSFVAYSTLIEPHLQSFLARYPELSFEVAIDNGLSDIVAHGFDAGVRLGHAVQKDMIGAPVGPVQQFIAVGSPAYLEKAGTPGTPQELLQHDCIRQRIGNAGRFLEWNFMDGDRVSSVQVSGQFIASEMRCALDAAKAGQGLAYVFRGFAAAALRSGELIPLLEGHSPPGETFYFYYANRAQMPAKLRAFIDFFQAAHWSVPG